MRERDPIVSRDQTLQTSASWLKTIAKLIAVAEIVLRMHVDLNVGFLIGNWHVTHILFEQSHQIQSAVMIPN
jgi:hypothetical protein